ncbi:Cof-type HAD-IIB family hydrolase [Bacillus spongiae]|uniref:Cof-type HAD-IIB family hydrolase n=1 Tax=Bacillus spongiae TaxID=2683610 RepID=A0ABU8HGF9_9BACI
MIRCIASDMDGTLLNHELKVTEENKIAIEKAKSQGVEVIIATGRSYAEARYALQEADLHLPIICSNGAEIRDEQGELIYHASMSREKAKKIALTLSELGIYYELYTNKGTYTESRELGIQILVDIYQSANPEVPEVLVRQAVEERFSNNGLIKVTDNYEQLFQDETLFINKFLAYSMDNKKLKQASETLANITEIAITSSGKENIEITAEHAQKGIALEQYINEKGITLKECMAIGDNFNDVSMLERVGYPVVMANSDEKVKALYSRQTASNRESGVGKAIEAVLSESIK